MIFKLSLPSVGKKALDKELFAECQKKHSAKSSLPSVKNKTLGKELFCRVFYFTERFLCGTQQRAFLPSAQKKHSAKYLVLDKERNSGSDVPSPSSTSGQNIQGIN
jgi:hypothetical protein